MVNACNRNMVRVRNSRGEIILTAVPDYHGETWGWNLPNVIKTVTTAKYPMQRACKEEAEITKNYKRIRKKLNDKIVKSANSSDAQDKAPEWLKKKEAREELKRERRQDQII